MGKPTFTPGPWAYGYSGANGYCITTRGGTHLATSILYKQDGGEANARLIAAAPAMLAALTECERRLRSDGYHLTADVALAAIAMAAGEAPHV